MTSTPTPNIRLTISVTPEVHQAFQRLAKASGSSIGKSMGEWLADTLEAVEFMASKVEQARAAPAIVLREMHAYALGLADETGVMMDKFREHGKEQRAVLARDARPVAPPIPPSSNTGGKGPKKHSKETIAHGDLSPKPRKRQNLIPTTKGPVGPAHVQAYADTNGVAPRAKS